MKMQHFPHFSSYADILKYHFPISFPIFGEGTMWMQQKEPHSEFKKTGFSTLQLSSATWGKSLSLSEPICTQEI